MPNRLAGEKSPYLRRHADNPVDWYPWCDEAFERARREDRPVFISIGYSSCHWCHVMERESFEDPWIATLLNEHFVCIKVDREERPDIDRVYMRYCTAVTGSGGWPLTVVATPEGEPFFVGTYFPKDSRFDMRGLVEILPHLAALYRRERSRIREVGGRAAGFLEREPRRAGTYAVDLLLLERAFEELRRAYDERHGGFGPAPKFPTTHNLFFLLRWWLRSGDERSVSMVRHTLDAMMRGGIHDHLGGGFHRYSTDERWLVPHFEKMLYDQALLALAYTEAFQATGRDRYRRIALETLEYVTGRLAAPDGGFCSAEDADTEGAEGRYYLWTRKEIVGLLGPEDGPLFCDLFGVAEQGRPGGGSVLHLERDIGAVSRETGVPRERLDDVAARGRELLLGARGRREPPPRDDKVLTDWNGLAIAALARAARALGQGRLAETAASAAGFLLTALRRGDGRLLHRYREGEAAIPGFLEDHAFLAWGLVELYETLFDAAHLSGAVEIADAMLELFAAAGGGFHQSGSDARFPFARTREAHDGAVPSGNSIAALVLLRLSRLTGRSRYEEAAAGALDYFSGDVAESPLSHTMLLVAADFALGPSREIVVVGGPGAPGTGALLDVLRSRFLPRSAVLFKPASGAEELAALAPSVREMETVGGRAAAYVCENFTCRAPVTDPDDLAALLE